MNNTDKIVKIAKALADKNRIKVLKEIAKNGSITCSEMEKLLSLSQPTVSHHIKVLIDSGLLDAEKQGRFLLMQLNKEMLKEFSPMIFNSITAK